MSWLVHVGKRSQKNLLKFPTKDQERIELILEELERNPFNGDIVRLGRNDWRRRTGNYRIFYTLNSDNFLIYVYKIERRTSKTYSK
jgi:mRNA-degrading endonuclease RelE of RelBE toxin-antitoxin system